MQVISRLELIQRLGIDEDLILIEVLDPESFRDWHLPGAVNVPLDDGFAEAVQKVAADKTRPVVVYGRDEECLRSGEAARRLDELGFTRVYNYTAGKADWRDAGLETAEGD